MDKLLCIENVIRCMKVIFVLKLVMVTSTPISLCSLSKICCLDRGTAEINSLPKDNLCTAIATYSANKDTSDKDIANLRENLPLVYILNDWNYGDMKYMLKPETINSFYDYLSTRISDKNINVLLFDNLYPTESEEVDTIFQDSIYTLFDEMKKRNPDVLFGLVISHNMNHMANAFPIDKLNNIVDVFLAKTYSYVQCNNNNYKQSEMAITSPIEEMRKTLGELTTLGYSLNKMVLIVRIIVNSSRLGDADADADESYSSFCSSEPGNRRKHCKESLSNFYQKGLLVNSNKMMGCLIQSVDRDDHENNCICGNYPVLNCISAGINGGPDPTTITTCGTFGILPRDRN